ncbi:hypothetical protein GGI21_005610 [Coemansia aciculifera]|nr:hypothetical protein GGI21_005610 [Coemansia aciculifera]
MLGHELRNCPKPLDRETIEANLSAFKGRKQGQFNSRLYLVVEEEKRANEMRQRIRPGQPLSQELREALGLERDDDVPEYVQSIYHHGYPPAYLGSTPHQDPLLTRDEAAIHPGPSTPMLEVFSEDVDYAGEPEADIEDPSASVAIKDAASGDEEGALSESEEGALSEGEVDDELDEQSTESKAIEKSDCNIPLVVYPGLDLAEFDFTSKSRPGKPLRRYTPRQSRYRYYDESQTSYYQSEPNSYDEPFEDMLDGYYRSSRPAADAYPHRQSGVATQPRYDDFTCHRRSPRPDTYLRNGSAQPVQSIPANSGDGMDNVDEDWEDGECEMSKSD